jgi:hypothetical protein
MSETSTGSETGTGAGPSSGHEPLSRALWSRKIGDVFRFVFDPSSEPGLSLERIGKKGSAPDDAARAGERGLMLVDGREGLAFFGAGDPDLLLERLATWARAAISETPALGLLADAGAGPLTFDPSDDAAARAFVPDGGTVVYRSELWDELLPPDARAVAAALAAATPGERMWFWLAEDESPGAIPLILQPIAWDPTHDRTNWLVDRNTERGAGAGVCGTAMVSDDGTIQLLGSGFHRDMLEQLARWVAANQDEHPALGRLVDCQLLETSGSTVERSLAEPALWEGVNRDEVPGTIRATAAALEALPEGGECWFWITGAQGGAAFLFLSDAAEDPDGEAFKAALPGLYTRFPRSFGDAITGLMARPSAARLLFSSGDAQVGQFSAQVRALLDRYGADFPALSILAEAALVQVGADEQVRVVQALPYIS